MFIILFLTADNQNKDENKYDESADKSSSEEPAEKEEVKKVKHVQYQVYYYKDIASFFTLLFNI